MRERVIPRERNRNAARIDRAEKLVASLFPSPSGRVVFIPSVEQGIMPSFRALAATGLVMEHRRLFYVSVTRAMAACIVSHAGSHSGPAAFALQQRPVVILPRSQFLNEMGVASVNRTQGLSPAEAAAIVADVNNL